MAKDTTLASTKGVSGNLVNIEMASDPSFALTVSENGSVDSVLSRYDAYIYALAQKFIPHQFARRASDDEFNMEVDELVQRSRIKLWHALEKRQVAFPKAYIRNIVYSECVDLARQHKSYVPLPVDDDGELYQGNAFLSAGEDVSDPGNILEQKERHTERLKELINIVLYRLTRRQKQAFLFGLRERIDDVDALNETLAEHEFELEDNICMPASRAERRSWQASCSQARRKIAQYMQLDSSSLVCI